MPFGMISGLAQAGVNLGIGLANLDQQKKTNEMNERLLRESWARDDTAFSRAYNDITRNGFSPLAVLGQTFGNTNPTALEAPQMSGVDLSGVSQGYSDYKNRKIAKAQQETAEKVADSQVNNLNADTRNKNSEADVNEATTVTQILKAKVELDNMIKSGVASEATVVKYLNDMKAEGVSDSVIDSLLNEYNAGYGSSDFKGNLSISTQNSLSSAQKSLVVAQKALAESQKGVSDANKAKLDADNEYWKEYGKELKHSIEEAQKGLLEAQKSGAEAANTKWITIYDATGEKQLLTTSDAVQFMNVLNGQLERQLKQKVVNYYEVEKITDNILSIFNSLGLRW